MPKIQFTGLVADMKGKANGSVFSTNSGGNYFRTNPSGGGRNSSRWDQQKKNFASISSIWRTLTDIEQNAWRTAAPDYPTTNAFGEPRIPSGYELFMRLNGTLASNGFPITITPQVPTNFPDPSPVTWSTPALHLYMPNLATALYDLNNPDDRIYLNARNIIVGGQITSNTTFSITAELPRILAYPFIPGNEIALMTVTDDATNTMRVFLKDITPAGATLEIECVWDLGDTTVTVAGPILEFLEAFTVTLTIPASGSDNMIVFINGEQQIVNVVANGTQTSGVGAYDLRVASDAPAALNNLIMSDLRFWDVILAPDDAKLVYHGYYLTTEKAAFGGGVHVGNTIVNEADTTLIPNATLEGWTASQKLLTNNVPAHFPQLTLNVGAVGNPLQYFVLYASAPQSNGRNMQSTNLKRIAVLDWATLDEYDFSEDWRNVFHSVSDGASLSIGYLLMDSSTGQRSITTAYSSNPARKGGFKAGSELSGKVN